MRIPILNLNGVFSYFPSSKPSKQLLNKCNKALLLTPDGTLDPNTHVYSRNQENILDYKGDVVKKKNRVRVLMSDIEDNNVMKISAVIIKAELSLINEIFH